MRKLFLVLLVLIVGSFSLYAFKSEKSHLNIGVISDLHYLSERLMDNSIAVKNYVNASGKNIIDLPEILDSVVDKYLTSNIDILLLTGDLTKDGERQSHIELTHKLAPLIDKGVKIFVIPGNHDVNMPNAVRYEGDKTFPVENISPFDFAKIYSSFGYGTALYRDSISLSYIAELDSETWLIALDGCLYEQYENTSISGGKIKESTLIWIKEIVDNAKKNNKQLIGMMHHGLVEHFPLQSTFFKDYLIENNNNLASFLADNGVEIMFTGHFHANDITEFISDKGNRIYDIETGALCAYPFSYRFVELSRTKLEIKTSNVTQIESNVNLVDESKSVLKEQARLRLISKMNSLGINIPPELKDKIADIGSIIFLQHLAGDEMIDEDVLNSIRTITQILDDSYSDTLDSIQLDFYPADNNVKIELHSN